MKTVWEKLAVASKSVLDVILPHFCAGCKKEKEALCQNCQSASFQKSFQCIICGARNQKGEFCATSCRRRLVQMASGEGQTNNALALHQVIFAGRYNGAFHDAIWEFKYKKRRELAGPLGQMLAKKFLLLDVSHDKEYIAIPMPLSKEKLRARGYNQAMELAEQFSQRTGIPILPNALKKIKETKAQVETKDREERAKNLSGVFAADERALAKHRDKIIILIDDVATTGATLAHASRALTRAGAKYIIGLVVAHG